ncbi:hypothetical protein AB6G19_12025 [Providencia manganoxydans]
MIYKIPVSNEPIQEQLFTVFGMNLRLTLYYNQLSKGWQFDLFDANNNRMITQMQGLAVNAPSLIEKIYLLFFYSVINHVLVLMQSLRMN